MNQKQNSESISVSVKITGLVAALLTLLILVINMITTVNANEIVVKQGVVSGALVVWSEPGPKAQNFGRITSYPRSNRYSFSAKKDEGTINDQSIKVRFNDGGHGNLSGTFQYDYPLDPAKMIELHKKFHDPNVIEQQLIRPVIERAIYMSGLL
jgi:hypothetical protein